MSRRVTLPFVAAACSALLLTVHPLEAQSARTPATADTLATSSGLSTPSAIARDARSFARRVGLWAAVGGGRGSAGLQCSACRSGQEPALLAHLAVGGRVHARFHVGIETWTYLDVIGNGVDRTARGTQLIARQYPLRDRAVFLVGGIGSSRFIVDDGDARFETSSPALSIGMGYDIPVRGVTLSPLISMVASTGGSLVSDRTGNSAADNARLGLWRSTLTITWF